jgi:hypothetical protein
MDFRSFTIAELAQYALVASTIFGVAYTLYWGFLFLTTPSTSVIAYIGCSAPNHGLYCDLAVHGVSVTYIILSVFFLALGSSYGAILGFYNSSKRLRSFLKKRKARRENHHIEEYLRTP